MSHSDKRKDSEVIFRRATIADAVAIARAHAEATLWVLAGNERARRFYEAAGWQPDGAEQTEPGPGGPLSEVRYRRSLR